MSHNKNQKGMCERHRCQYCRKPYMMEWAKNNHEKHCREQGKKKWAIIKIVKNANIQWTNDAGIHMETNPKDRECFIVKIAEE